MVAVLLEAFAYLFPDGGIFFFGFAVGGHLFDPFIFVMDVDDGYHAAIQSPVQNIFYTVHQVGMYFIVIGEQIAPTDRNAQG